MSFTPSRYNLPSTLPKNNNSTKEKLGKEIPIFPPSTDYSEDSKRPLGNQDLIKDKNDDKNSQVKLNNTLFTIKSNKTSYITMPEIEEVTSEFIYNFFTKDEKTKPFDNFNNSKDLKKIPKYVKLNFNLKNEYKNKKNFSNLSYNEVLSDAKNSQFIFDETDYISFVENNLNFSDRNIDSRINKKLELLSQILTGSQDFQTNKQIKENIKKKFKTKDFSEIENLLNSSVSTGILKVNQLGEVRKTNVFIEASTSDLFTKIDQRFEGDILSDNFKNFKFARLSINESVNEENKNFVASIYNFDNIDEPNFIALESNKLKSNIGTNTEYDIIGYKICRYEIINGILDESTKYEFYLDSFGINNVIDSSILYNRVYTYSISVVCIVKFCTKNIKTENLEAGYYENIGLVSSKPVFTKQLINTIEIVAPKEPDGIFYKFNYEKNIGLKISWQIPSGKSRDVKYFQIFKRNSINEPFTCIAEIDFDDSEIKTQRNEIVKEENIIKSFNKNGDSIMLTSYEDSSFDRNVGKNGPIYAICAIDAHNLTSGYSSQTKVNFDNSRNKIELIPISRPGAPKEYPNIYINPTLSDNIFTEKITQDAIFSSGKKKFTLYFNPDAFSYKLNVNEVGVQGIKNIVNIKNKNGAYYKFHFINLDRQKSDVFHVEVEDLRK